MITHKRQANDDHLDMALQFENGEDTYLDFRLALHDIIETSAPAYAIGGVVTGTKGNFTVISAPPKAGKSTVVASMVAAALCGEIGPITSDLKGSILYVDTEQGKEHCQAILRRIKTTSDVLEYELHDRLFFLTLREQCTEDRFMYIEQAIYDRATVGLELVIIDGIRDLVYDINDTKECTLIIDKLMEWTAKFDIHIICILHENKGNGQLRGHLGTEAQNKAETVMRVEKVSSNSCRVEPRYTRNKEFPAFTVTINPDGELIAAPDSGKEKQKPVEFDEQLIKGLVCAVFKEKPVYESKNALKTAIKKYYFECTQKTIGDNKAREIIEYMDLTDLIEITELNSRQMEIRAMPDPLFRAVC